MATLKKSKLKKAQDGEAMPRKFTEGYEETPNTMRSSADRAHARSKYESENQFKAKTPEKKQSFGEAFKTAKSDPNNKGTFSWNGKSYTTQTKEEATKKTTPAAKSSVSKSNPNTVNKIGEVEVIGKKPAPKSNPNTVKKIGEVTVTGKKPSLLKFPYGFSPTSLKCGGKTKKR